MSQITRCWCGNERLVEFSDSYMRCGDCETLVTRHDPAQPHPHVSNDEADFYGKTYWFKHQEKDLGFANIEARARLDLVERCQHWLRILLRYKLPPAKTLELGCAHGGFVAMLRHAGFESAGLELSPWVVDLARRTFDVPMYVGPIEEQKIEPGSLDVIAMMDVMEHLPDPLSTLKRCAELLKPDGVLIAQTPCFPVGRSFEQMVASNDRFMEQFKAEEHLYLFSEKSAEEIFRRIGLMHVNTEPAMFAHYDMFLFASASPLSPRSDEGVEQELLRSPRGRMTLTWLDMSRQSGKMQAELAAIDADRAHRLTDVEQLTAQVNALQARLVEVEADRESRLEQIQKLSAELAQSEIDRAARLEQILKLTNDLAAVSANRDGLLDQLRQMHTLVAQGQNGP